MTTGDATLDRVVYLASWLFLVGVVLIVATAVPAVQRRFPRIMLYGSLVALASFVLVGVAWAVLA